MDAGIGDIDSQNRNPPLERAVANIFLKFDDARTTTINLPLVGPGDIIGLDSRAIVRTFPRRDDNDAEFGHFAMIESDQADLPWRYTPAKPAGDVSAGTDNLRPWMTVIVLVEGEEFLENAFTPASLSQKLPQLTVARKFLPPEKELWAWSHLQVSGVIAGDGPLQDAIKGTPGQVVSRILSPRILKPQKAYRAFVVPTFERGRLIGTGGDPAGVDALAPAWTTGGADPVSLPVYYDWRFQTGTAGSFETLIAALAPRGLDATVGRRPMNGKEPGLNLSPPATEPILVAGALQSVKAAGIIDPPPAADWVKGLQAFLDASELKAFDEDGNLITPNPKVVTPPLYGRWYAAQTKLLDPPLWFFNLNSDPRYRVAAALGTEVVQREQQSLMDAAWRQIDQLRSINYERKILQAARSAFGRYMLRHIRVGSLETQLSITGQFHGRILVAPDTTAFARLKTTALGAEFFDPRWRRFVSPRGILGRRLGLPALPVGQVSNLFTSIVSGAIQLAPTPIPPVGANLSDTIWGTAIAGSPTDKQITDLTNQLGKDRLLFWGLVLFWVGRRLLIDLKGQFWWLSHQLIRLGFSLIKLANDPLLVREKLRDALRTDTLTGDAVNKAPRAPNFVVRTDIDLRKPATLPPEAVLLPAADAKDTVDAEKFRAAAAELMDYRTRPRTQPTPLKIIDLPGLAKTLLDGIEPATTLVESQKFRVSFDDPAWKAPDPLEPIQSTPTFDRPMQESLRAISDEWILPSVGTVPQDTVALLVPNQRFIEAFMAGLNHEMTRELIWNEFPVDQRGTYFRQFWDSRAFLKGEGPARTTTELQDILPIKDWDAAKDLGKHSPRPEVDPAHGSRVVLLVRGQLIKRYPNVIVYAATSATRDIVPLPATYEERHPIFHGFLGGDVAYYAFDLGVDLVTAAGSPWYFILQEQPAEPRFFVPHPGTLPADLINARVGNEFGAVTSAAAVAFDGFQPPNRIAVKGSSLLTTTQP